MLSRIDLCHLTYDAYIKHPRNQFKKKSRMRRCAPASVTGSLVTGSLVTGSLGGHAVQVIFCAT
jgi:hypothetical protein